MSQLPWNPCVPVERLRRNTARWVGLREVLEQLHARRRGEEAWYTEYMNECPAQHPQCDGPGRAGWRG
jgi:hypothetical protein